MIGKLEIEVNIYYSMYSNIRMKKSNGGVFPWL